ncbi:hypothetical protein EV426DRAFT_113772 [Tirmania nivea]|nr:hypothetical protein EV426DRAFT_113772 [Tirmania nivea]
MINRVLAAFCLVLVQQSYYFHTNFFFVNQYSHYSMLLMGKTNHPTGPLFEFTPTTIIIGLGVNRSRLLSAFIKLVTVRKPSDVSVSSNGDLFRLGVLLNFCIQYHELLKPQILKHYSRTVHIYSPSRGFKSCKL